ncbi:MAG TPA: DUF1178 family protein [Acetobacteraceae bacterium]|jgi:hypothetical protein
MIHYQLRCSQGHEFDGWFSDSAGFDRQAKRGLVECPVCADVKVTRAMMAPAVATREAPKAAPPPPVPAASEAVPPAAAPQVPAPVAGGPMPAHLRAMLQHMRAEVEKHCDYVGPSFADEARKMHRGESEKRGIYGETTPTEAESLAEEGIEVSSIPWVPRADG